MIAPTRKMITLFDFTGALGTVARSAIAMFTMLDSSRALENRASSSFFA